MQGIALGAVLLLMLVAGVQSIRGGLHGLRGRRLGLRGMHGQTGAVSGWLGDDARSASLRALGSALRIGTSA